MSSAKYSAPASSPPRADAINAASTTATFACDIAAQYLASAIADEKGSFPCRGGLLAPGRSSRPHLVRLRAAFVRHPRAKAKVSLGSTAVLDGAVPSDQTLPGQEPKTR